MNNIRFAHIALVINNDEVIVNKGTDEGISACCEFYTAKPIQQVQDPFTGEDLGLAWEKTSVWKPVEVYSHMTKLRLVGRAGKQQSAFDATPVRTFTVVYVPQLKDGIFYEPHMGKGGEHE